MIIQHIRRILCCCTTPLGFLFTRWRNFSPGGLYHDVPYPPPDMKLPEDDSQWQPPGDLPYTNLHITDNGVFHLAGRVYNPDKTLMYEGPDFCNTPTGAAQWQVVDESGNLYAIELVTNFAATTGSITVNVWKYDAVGQNIEAVHTKVFPANAWQNIGSSGTGGGFVNPPQRALIDCRFGYLAYAGPGGTVFEPNGVTRFEGNTTATVIQLLTPTGTGSDAQDEEVDWWGPNVALDNWESCAFVADPIPSQGPAFGEARPVMLKIGDDGGLYVSTYPSRPEGYFGGSSPGLVNLKEQLGACGFLNSDGSTGTIIGFRQLACHVSHLFDPPSPPCPLGFYGKWWGLDTPGNWWCHGHGGHFDVDQDGNVILSLWAYQPGISGAACTFVRLTPEQGPTGQESTSIEEHIDCFSSFDSSMSQCAPGVGTGTEGTGTFVNCPPSRPCEEIWYSVRIDGTGEERGNYIKEWEEFDPLADPSTCWVIHDFAGAIEGNGGWYRDFQCVRHTNGSVTPNFSFRWARQPLCDPVTPSFITRSGPNVGATLSGTPGMATNGPLVFDPDPGCPDCDEDESGLTTACCPNDYLPALLFGNVTVNGDATGFLLSPDGRVITDPFGAGQIDLSGRHRIFDPISGTYVYPFTGPWNGWIFRTPGCCCGAKPIYFTLQCVEVEPGEHVFQLTVSYIRDWENYPVGLVSNTYLPDADSLNCSDPFSVVFSNVDLDTLSCDTGTVAISDLVSTVFPNYFPTTLEATVTNVALISTGGQCGAGATVSVEASTFIGAQIGGGTTSDPNMSGVPLDLRYSGTIKVTLDQCACGPELVFPARIYCADPPDPGQPVRMEILVDGFPFEANGFAVCDPLGIDFNGAISITLPFPCDLVEITFDLILTE